MDGNRTEKEAGDGAAGEESPTVVETNSEPNNVPAAPPEEAYKPLQKNLAILALGIGLILFTLDATLVTTALPTIARELDGAETYSWIGTAYLLSATALAPLWGRFMDVFGRKSVLVFNCVLFTVISIPLAMAPSMNVLILCRAIQGIGGGGLQAGTFVVVSEVVSMRERGKYQGMMMALSGISAVVGPLLGGVLWVTRRSGAGETERAP